jgi:hypothetical protein
MRLARLTLFAIIGISLASCGKPEGGKNASGDPCDNAKAQPPYLTQEQAAKACKDNRNFAGAPTKRSNIHITNH